MKTVGMFLIIATLTAFAFGDKVMEIGFPEPIIVHDTIYIQDTLTIYRIDTDTIYRDTCDSQFMKTILEVESGLVTEYRTNSPKQHERVIGDGGKAHGNFGIHNIAITHTPCKVMGYTHHDMFDLEKASHVFWAKMGAYTYRYRKEYNEMPTYETLARMWNGSYNRHKHISTEKYARKFNKVFAKL